MAHQKTPEIPFLTPEELEATIENAAWNMADLRMMCVNLVDDIIERELWHAEGSDAIIASIKNETMKIITRSIKVAKKENTQPLDFETIYQQRWSKKRTLAS